MSTTDSVTRNALVANAMAITEREMRVYGERTRASQVATDSGAQGDAGGRPIELPGVRAPSDRRAPRFGLADDRRRRQRVRRLRHGLRRACSPDTCIPRCGVPSKPSSITARSTSRRACSTPRWASCWPTATGMPMWRPTNSGTEATMDAIRLARGVTKREQDRQGRRRVPRPPRRGDDLQQAAARQGRAGRRAELGAAVGGHHERHRRRRHRDPVQRPGRARTGTGERRRRVLHRRAGAAEHRDLSAAARLSRSGPRDHRAARNAVDLRRGQDRNHGWLRRSDRVTSACSPT